MFRSPREQRVKVAVEAASSCDVYTAAFSFLLLPLPHIRSPTVYTYAHTSRLHNFVLILVGATTLISNAFLHSTVIN